MSKFRQILLVMLGSIFVAVGVIGIFLPLLPTTPFLLLGASCFIRGSDRMYNWLINNKLLGEYIRNFREKNGIPLRTKIIAVSMLWTTMLYSIAFVMDNLFMKALLLIIASTVTWHILMQKTLVEGLAEEQKIENIEVEGEDTSLRSE